MLPAPGFHHLHLNSVDPDAAIDWYTRQFPSTRRADWGGFAALQSERVCVQFPVLFRDPSPAWTAIASAFRRISPRQPTRSD